MRTLSKSLFALCFATLILSGCTDPFSHGNGPSKEDVAHSQAVKGANYSLVAPIMAAYCVQCHSGFASYSGVVSALADIRRVVFEARTMPPAGHPMLTGGEAATLQAWILAGGPQDASVTPTPTPDASPLPATYTYIQTQILNAKCIKCHGPTSKHVHLTGYADFFTPGGDVVVRNQPELSTLYQVLLDGAETPMPPPKAHLTPATAAEREAIRQWILSGAELN
jgi:uncharacterized membrane protein